jgi:arylsulfatase A-like enzyme|tara:strand:- start:4441 stop:5844 length:1404 start_codon:yes stop_codon:yes gene_type:complete
MRNIFFIILILCFSCKKNNDLPNIVLILTDDLGYNDVGFNGSTEIMTPNIDSIAKNGVLFTDGYVSYPVCGPSRAGLMTGRYQDTFGFGKNPLFAPKDPNMGLTLSEQTMADMLKLSNYTTLAVGKWHLGAHESLRPMKRGFDHFFGFLTGGHRFFPEEWTLADETKVKNQGAAYRTKLLRDDQRVEEKEYLTDALSRESVDFIDKNSDKPFFIYLAYNAPHGPLQATQEYLDRYDHIEENSRKTYAAMVSAVDDGVGDIISKLKEKGIYDNTIIYFLSDNGGRLRGDSDNGELRGKKGNLFEGGIRVPFAMQWPKEIEGGQVFKKPIISLDIFATLKEITSPEIRSKNELHGVNLIPFLKGENKNDPHKFLFWRNNLMQNDPNLRIEALALRSGEFKFIKNKETDALYNLKNEVFEETNLKNQKIEIYDSLNNKFNEWYKTLMDPTFLGLMANDEYNELNPERFKY